MLLLCPSLAHLVQIPEGEKTLSISGTKFRGMMARGDPIPDWYSDPDVIAILRHISPPLHKRGFGLLFTGLSGGGKTTIAHGLIQRLGGLVPTRAITFLDGDVVRTHLSRGLGFSLADRNANVERIGWVAGEAVRHGGIVLASPIGPLAESRRAVRKHVSGSGGGFFQVYVASSLGTCASRDVKGLYELAAGGRTDLTGVSHPYEAPDADVDLVLDTAGVSVDEAVSMIVAMLVKAGYIAEEEVAADLTAAEKSLLAAMPAPGGASSPSAAIAAPASPSADGSLARLLPYFTKGAVDVLATVPALAASDGAAASAIGFCYAGWDEMWVSRAQAAAPGKAATVQEVRLFGGLPMQASLAYAPVSALVRRDPDTGSITQPPATLVVGVAEGAAARWLHSIAAAVGAAPAAAPSFAYALSPAYLEAAQQVAALGATNEAAAKEAAAKVAGEWAGDSPLIAPRGAASFDVPTALRADVLGVGTDAGAAVPKAAQLPEAARVFAGFDLWAHMRWQWHAEAEAEAGVAQGARPLTLFTASDRALPFLPHMLRFDPCFRAVIVLAAAHANATSTPHFDAAASALHLQAVEVAAQLLAQRDAGEDLPTGGSIAPARVAARGKADKRGRMLLEATQLKAAAKVAAPAASGALRTAAQADGGASAPARNPATAKTAKAAVAGAKKAAAAPGSPASHSAPALAAKAPAKTSASVGGAVNVAKSRGTPAQQLQEAAARVYARVLMPSQEAVAQAARALAAAFPSRVLLVEVTAAADMAWLLRAHGPAQSGDEEGTPQWMDAADAIYGQVSAAAATTAGPELPPPPAGVAELEQRVSDFMSGVLAATQLGV